MTRPADDGTTLLVTRPCYLALRRALNLRITGDVAGVVVVMEPGRALGCDDIAAVTGLPVIATVPLWVEIARAVDAGVLAARVPEQLVTAAATTTSCTGPSPMPAPSSPVL